MDFNWDQIEAYNRPSDDMENLLAPPEQIKRSSQNNNSKSTANQDRHREEFLRMVSQGCSKAHVARVLGVSLTWVAHLSRKYQVQFLSDREVTPDHKKMMHTVATYARQGCTPVEVASILNIDEQKIVQYAHASAIVFREQPNVLRELLG